ncbi:MAG: hypothetical protein U0Y08_10235 [Bacteroidia bacterium]
MKRGVQISLAFLIILLFIFLFLNNRGENYVYYNIQNGEGKYKANLLKHFLDEYCEVKECDLLVKNRTQEILRHWKINRTESLDVYYKIVDEKPEALGWFEYYKIDKEIKVQEYITINMEICPDNSSAVTIIKLDNCENWISYRGKVKLGDFMGYNKIGMEIFNSMVNGTFNERLVVNDTVLNQSILKSKFLHIFEL